MQQVLRLGLYWEGVKACKQECLCKIEGMHMLEHVHIQACRHLLSLFRRQPMGFGHASKY